MLMKTRAVDFFYVSPDHHKIHDRLEDWARWCAVHRPAWTSPIWKMGKSNGRQWHAPELRPGCNIPECQDTEKAVRHLPILHRAALRWCYVYKYGESRFRREHGVTPDSLMLLIHDGRRMLVNRLLTLNS